MNKKQLIIIGVMSILIIFNCIAPPYPPFSRGSLGAPVDTGKLIANIILIITVGSLLIYTLRDKKK